MAEPTSSTDVADLMRQAEQNWQSYKQQPDAQPHPVLGAIRGALPGTFDHVDDATLAQAILKNPKAVVGSLRAKSPEQYAHLDDDTVAQALVTKLQAPPQQREVPAAIQTLDKVGQTLKEPIDRFMQGVTSNVTGLRNLPAAIAGAPKQIAADVQALRDDPKAALTQFGHRAAGMFGPAAEKISEGKLPGVGDIAETAGGLIGAEALGGATSALVKGALKKLITNLPGSAVEKHALAATQMRKMAEDLKPPAGVVASEYNALAQMGNPSLTMPTLSSRIQGMIDKELQLPRTGAVGGQDEAWLDRLRELKSDADQGWEFNKAKAWHEAIGEEMNTPAQPQAGTPGSRAPIRRDQELRSLMQAGLEDVRNGAPAHADQWERARALAHKEKSATELLASVNKVIGVTGDARVTAGRLNQLIGKIRQLREGAASFKDRAALRWVQGFTSTELDALVEKLTELKQALPAIPAGRGVPTGSSLAIPRALLGGAIGSGIGGTMGGWEGGRIGAAIGSTAIEGGYRLSRWAMATPRGRAVVRRALLMDPTRGPFFQHIVAAHLRNEASAEQQTKHEFQRAAMEKDAGKLLDQWHIASAHDREWLRPVLMLKLMRGKDPAHRDELIAELRPNSLPEAAPVH